MPVQSNQMHAHAHTHLNDDPEFWKVRSQHRGEVSDDMVYDPHALVLSAVACIQLLHILLKNLLKQG